jgi:HSP20 family protein
MAEDIKKDVERVPAQRYQDPFSAMRMEMDRMFENFMTRGLGGFPRIAAGERSGNMIPSVDVRESNGEIVVEAELPGLDEKDVEVTLRDGVLRIRGEKRSTREEKKDDYHLTERSYGRYERAFRLPDGIDEDKIKADIKNGVLLVTVPKKPEAVSNEKKIQIRQSG